MKFLVILVCLTINYLWLKDVDRFDDSWFFRLRSWLQETTSKFGDRPNGWLLPVALTYVLLLGLLAFVLWLANGLVFGIATMLVHIMVVLIAFDRTQPGMMAREYLDRLGAQGDQEARDYLQQEMRCSEPVPEPRDQMTRMFGRLLIHRAFERMFVMFFWYMLAGAPGVVFTYISYQMQDSHREDQEQNEVQFIASIIGLLEWIPMRLLALTFSLAGNFVQCFESLKRNFWETDLHVDNGALLHDYASCALSGIVEMGSGPESGTDREAIEISALQGLLERSQAIWLTVLAAITLLDLPI
ncbi:MAG: regulatory signaling modulator protein AmpE [Gammaproteobacteria bacterium]